MGFCIELSVCNRWVRLLYGDNIWFCKLAMVKIMYNLATKGQFQNPCNFSHNYRTTDPCYHKLIVTLAYGQLRTISNPRRLFQSFFLK